MPRKRRAASRSELHARVVVLSWVAGRVGSRIDEPRGQRPAIETSAWLELRGQLEEPVRGITDVLFSLYPQDEVKAGTARPASVGSIIGLKPAMSVVLPWPHRDFNRLWMLALSGRLGFAHLIFTTPHYNRAAVVSASFSTEREE